MSWRWVAFGVLSVAGMFFLSIGTPEALGAVLWVWMCSWLAQGQIVARARRVKAGRGLPAGTGAVFTQVAQQEPVAMGGK